MSVIVSNYNNYVSINTTLTLVTGAGKIHRIIMSCNSATLQAVTLYDNTAASGNVIMVFYISQYSGVTDIPLDSRMPLIFSTGLTVVTGANCTAFIITEE